MNRRNAAVTGRYSALFFSLLTVFVLPLNAERESDDETISELLRGSKMVAHVQILETARPFENSGLVSLKVAKCRLIGMWTKSKEPEEVPLLALSDGWIFVAYISSAVGGPILLEEQEEYILVSNYEDVVPFMFSSRFVFSIEDDFVIRQSLSQSQRKQTFDKSAKDWENTPIPKEYFLRWIGEHSEFRERWPKEDTRQP